MSENKGTKLINESPQNFIRMAAINQDSKELLSTHSLLHQWAQEIASSSPTMEIGENRWTLPWIAAAHEAVIRRITQLKPKWQHDSPLTASAFSPRPIILERAAVDISGAKHDVSVMIDSQILAEGALSRIAEHFKGKVSASVHPNNLGSMYHLALIPASQWRELEQDKEKAAMTAFRSALGPFASDPGYFPSIVKASAEISILAREANDRLSAEAAAIELASKVISGDDIQPDYSQKIRASNIYSEEMFKAGMEVIMGLLEPIENYALVDKAESMLRAEIKKAKIEGRTTKVGAENFARQLGYVIAGKVKGK